MSPAAGELAKRLDTAASRSKLSAMSLRLVELVVPRGRDAELDGLLDDGEVVERWNVELDGAKTGVRLLVERPRVERLIDKLEDRYGHMPGFRIVLVKVELALPAAEEHDDGDPEANPEAARRPVAGRVSRQELHAKMIAETRATGEFFVMVTLAAVVAAIGLLADSVAIVIAAMVIAPLLGPNMALAIATAIGDGKLARRALRLGLEGFALALVISLLIGLVHDHDVLPREIRSRTETHAYDIALALAAGVAGTFAFTTGASGTLIGVMVAVALIPPTIVIGVTAGASEWGAAGGAALLLATNVICVNLAAVGTFAIMGVRPARWWQAARARRATRRALTVLLGLLGGLAMLLWRPWA